jgi:hypothetical protein
LVEKVLLPTPPLGFITAITSIAIPYRINILEPRNSTNRNASNAATYKKRNSGVF